MERNSDRVTYRCRLCRHQLFDSTCVTNAATSHQISAGPTPTSPIQQSFAAPAPSRTPSEDGTGMSKVPLFPRDRGAPSGLSSGVLAPYGQVMSGPNPLWFIDEDLTPPWVRRTLDKFQWKKGKLSCPKCYGRVGSFDFVTPSKFHCDNRRASRIHIMRSRVDCESSSPIIARIRPMPQSPPFQSASHPLFSEGTTSSERHSPRVDNSSPELDSDSAVHLASVSFMPSPTDSASRPFHPEAFSSASDEETMPTPPTSIDFQRAVSLSQPGEQQSTTEPTMVHHTEHSQRFERRMDRQMAGTSAYNNQLFISSNQDHVRRRVINKKVPAERSVSFGLHSQSSRSESNAGMNATLAERNIAIVSGTNRISDKRTQFACPVPVSQPSTSRDHFAQYAREADRHQIWQYDSAQDEDEQEECMRFYSPTTSNSGPTPIPHSRSSDISSNIFKNSQAFLRPFITSSVATNRARSPGPSNNPSQGLYSQIPPLDQDRTNSSPREPRHTTAQGPVGRDSEDDDDATHADEANHGENLVSVFRQRSPREQRKERNRKKKERRKQRRYEKWLERQTLGAEEESAIQDISAAGLYSLLGPRCAGSSLREVTTCSVCLDIYYQPHTCYPCEHIFCEPCLRQVARFHPVVTPCPLCRTTIRTVKLHDKLTSSVKQLFPRQFENRNQLERRTLNRSFPLPGNSNLPPWYRYQTSRSQVDFLASRRNPGYVHDWGMRYLQGVVWRVVASTIVLLIVSGISIGFLHFMFDFS